MIFSERKRFIFFAAGKTGTSSIEKVLQEYADPPPFDLDFGPGNRPKHIPPRVVLPRLGEEATKRYFTFAFVRNPWDWVISEYFFNLQKHEGRRRRLLRRLGLIRDITTFGEEGFRRHWETMKLFRRGTHPENRFQLAFLADESGRLLVDFVGRFERLQADFDTICDRIEIPRQALPHVNASRRGRYTDYYCDTTRELVAQHYKKDIEFFGYRFGE